MILDGRKLKSGANIDCDICIVGSGPAGITLALELANSKKRVCILEAGDYKASKADLNEFFSGDNVGLPYKLTDCRSRQFGGTSVQWAGYLAMMDSRDFKKNRGIPLSGWPISYESLLPYYDRAYKLLGGSHFEFDPDRLMRPQYEKIRFKSDEVTSKIWHFNSANFAEMFGEFFGKSESMDVYLNASLSKINLDRAANRVSHLTVATSVKTTFTVRANTIVLACGGLENARILLAQTRSIRTAFDNDNIGRYFMEHPHYINCANLLLFGPHANSKLYNLPAQMKLGNITACAFFQIGSEIREKLELPNAVFRVQRPNSPIKQYTRVSMTLKGLYNGDESNERTSRLAVMAEQIPNSASRISLSDKVDKYRMPKIRLDWQLTKDEIMKTSQSMRIFGLKLGQNGLGRLQVEDWFAKGKVDGHVNYGWHHMGATRMALTSQNGVVDTNCRMYDLDNLYIAGSSVFPTSGCANPTFTIMAMTIRLADYLKVKKI